MNPFIFVFPPPPCFLETLRYLKRIIYSSPPKGFSLAFYLFRYTFVIFRLFALVLYVYIYVHVYIYVSILCSCIFAVSEAMSLHYLMHSYFVVSEAISNASWSFIIPFERILVRIRVLRRGEARVHGLLLFHLKELCSCLFAVSEAMSIYDQCMRACYYSICKDYEFVLYWIRIRIPDSSGM